MVGVAPSRCIFVRKQRRSMDHQQRIAFIHDSFEVARWLQSGPEWTRPCSVIVNTIHLVDLEAGLTAYRPYTRSSVDPESSRPFRLLAREFVAASALFFNRITTVASATNYRLGSNSPISLLGPYDLTLICKTYLDSEFDACSEESVWETPVYVPFYVPVGVTRASSSPDGCISTMRAITASNFSPDCMRFTAKRRDRYTQFIKSRGLMSMIYEDDFVSGPADAHISAIIYAFGGYCEALNMIALMSYAFPNLIHKVKNLDEYINGHLSYYNMTERLGMSPDLQFGPVQSALERANTVATIDRQTRKSAEFERPLVPMAATYCYQLGLNTLKLRDDLSQEKLRDCISDQTALYADLFSFYGIRLIKEYQELLSEIVKRKSSDAEERIMPKKKRARNLV